MYRIVLLNCFQYNFFGSKIIQSDKKYIGSYIISPVQTPLKIQAKKYIKINPNIHVLGWLRIIENTVET